MRGKDFATLLDNIGRLELPQQFSPEDLQRAQRDGEILAGKRRDSPTEMAALLTTIVQRKGHGTRQAVEQLGLTEEQVSAQGGGLMWLVVVAVLLYATDAY
ncbi:MAG: hypothetical protein M3Q65_06995 [Chloroflexota bacterium]|nr:hypothetical protein [Chloroflexota bacterium]